MKTAVGGGGSGRDGVGGGEHVGRHAGAEETRSEAEASAIPCW